MRTAREDRPTSPPTVTAMGRTYDVIDQTLRDWLQAQPLFFVATAPLAPDGLLNCSPKGLAGTFRVVGDREVAYLDLTGSGVETVAHLRENGRIVLMFCAFDGPPRIVRLHGRGTVVLPGTARFDDLVAGFSDQPGVRSVVVVHVDRIADSCGFGVPEMAYLRDRETLGDLARRKGPDGLARYRGDRNATSLDGLPGLPG